MQSAFVAEAARWMRSAFCCWRPHPGARHQTHNVECSEVRLFQMVSLQWLELSVSVLVVVHQMSFLRLTTGQLDTVI